MSAKVPKGGEGFDIRPAVYNIRQQNVGMHTNYISLVSSRGGVVRAQNAQVVDQGSRLKQH